MLAYYFIISAINGSTPFQICILSIVYMYTTAIEYNASMIFRTNNPDRGVNTGQLVADPAENVNQCKSR